MTDKLELDKTIFDVLSSGTRIDILKALDKRQRTVTELASELNLSKSTVYEHLSKLISAGLVKKIKRDNYKWVYYAPTDKALILLHNNVKKIIFLFSSTIIAIVIGIFELITYIVGKTEMVRSLIEETGEKALTKGNAIGVTVHNKIHLIISILLFVIAVSLMTYYWKKIRKK